jgi:hypothetical protein
MFADDPPMIYDIVYWRKMFADPLTPKPEGFIAAILYGDEYWALVKNERDRFPQLKIAWSDADKSTCVYAVASRRPAAPGGLAGEFAGERKAIAADPIHQPW